MWLAEILILIAVFSYVYSSGLASVGWVSIMQGLLMFVIAIIALSTCATNLRVTLERVYYL